ncbi:hypothetical protein ACIPYQ_34030 [Streptomyces sp. NPDC090045]|uniref:hypothetical protein n=1 Tax=Streptomyces sp. NPDC090045 TaxID=3365927 RepID=UPI003810109A
MLETARAAAERARNDAQRMEQVAQAGLDHAELLLRASEELAQTSGLEDVRRRCGTSSSASGNPRTSACSSPTRTNCTGLPTRTSSTVEQEVLTLPVNAAFASTRAMRERRAVFVPDREALVAEYSPEAVGFFDRMGFSTVLCLPLWGSRVRFHRVRRLAPTTSLTRRRARRTHGHGGRHTGHDMRAATITGQIRSMLRQAAIAQLVALLARHGDRPLAELLRQVSSRLPDPAPGDDDVVVLALPVP